MRVLDRFRLDDRVVVVTGASSGLGVAFAQACAEAGADLVLAGRRLDRLEETAETVRRVGRRAVTVATDVSDPEACRAMVDQALARFGRVDVLVNNTGVGTAVPATRESPEEFRRVIDVNLNGSYWAAQACGRVMQPGSCIVNVSSTVGLKTATLPQAAYAASKAGVLGRTRDLALQWGTRRGIRVNALAPGLFRSQMNKEHFESHESSLVPRIVLGRAGQGHEIAATLVWLVSDAASYVTGQTIVCDGGFTIT